MFHAFLAANAPVRVVLKIVVNVSMQKLFQIKVDKALWDTHTINILLIGSSSVPNWGLKFAALASTRSVRQRGFSNGLLKQINISHRYFIIKVLSALHQMRRPLSSFGWRKERTILLVLLARVNVYFMLSTDRVILCCIKEFSLVALVDPYVPASLRLDSPWLDLVWTCGPLFKTGMNILDTLILQIRLG